MIKRLSVDVLLSCMNQFDRSLYNSMNLETGLIAVNQCDRDYMDSYIYAGHIFNIISSLSKGLSVSRNIALENSKADICVITDDDVVFENNYSSNIIQAYNELKDADIILFNVGRSGYTYPIKAKKINTFSSLRAFSCQITFKRESIINNSIRFDENFGAGTHNGGGEDNIFLIDCLRKGLKIYSYPFQMCRLLPSESSWFRGYTKEYLVNRGKFCKRMFGLLGFVYIFYFAIKNRTRFKKIPFVNVLFYQFIGFVDYKLQEK